jgi:DNA-binding FadR family transcriptional regulator
MQGKGTYVLSDNLGATMMRNMTRNLDMSEQEYIEIIELRQTIEYKSLELIVKKGTKDDLKHLEEALKDMKSSLDDYKKFAEADLRFHFAIIKGSHNRLFYAIINSCRGALEKYFTEMNKVNFDGFKDPIQKHQEIYLALKKGNFELAQSIMLGVIETNLKNNMGYLRK